MEITSKTITDELRAKVLAQYLGQKFKALNDIDEEYFNCKQGDLFILKLINYGSLQIQASDDCESWNLGFETDGSYMCDWFDTKDFKLLLKPLSAITDVDVIEVAKELGLGHFKDTEGFIKAMKEGENLKVGKMLKNVFAYQYLQSKGYDLPNYYLNGKTLQEVGLAIYE